MVWKGVIIEESREDKRLLDMIKVVSSREETLQHEEERGLMKLLCFELEDEKKEEFIYKAKEMIKQAWWIHICREGTMVVIFKGKSFEFTKDEKDKIEEAREYAKSIGILQTGFEKLIDNPHA